MSAQIKINEKVQEKKFYFTPKWTEPIILNCHNMK